MIALRTVGRVLGVAPRVALAVLLLLVAGSGSAQELERADYDEAVTSAGRINLTVANYGKTGNDFRSRSQASFEYPSGSEHEHMVRGGVWIGGQVISGGLQTYVTTGVNDGSEGAALGEGAEFVPRRLSTWPQGTNILRRSRQTSDQFYSPEAIADQELIAYFDDAVPIPGGTDPHTPLRLKVKQTALVWGFAPFENIVFLNYEVTNTDPVRTITDLYVGAYAELSTGNKGTSDRWPPGGQWYGQKDIEWLDSLRVVREHRPASDDAVAADTYCGLQLLGTSQGIDTQTVTFTWWEWSRGTPNNDVERYATMSRGTDTPTEGSEAGRSDPVSLISAGPFPVLAAGEADTLRFSIAYLGGLDAEEIEDHARIAIGAYEAGFDIPVPPPVPNFLVDPGPNEITLRWDDLPERTPDEQSGEIDFEGYRIYLSRRPDATEFEWLKEVDIVDDYQFPEDQTQEDIRFNTGLGSVVADDPITVVAEGDTIVYEYAYTIRNLRDGFKYWTAITAFDRGTQDLPPLESGINLSRTLAIPGTNPVAFREGSDRVGVFPNPYRGAAVWDGGLIRDRYLWFTNLPARARIRIYTLAGDLVDTIDFDGEAYDAQDIRGIYDPTDPTSPDRDLPVLSGGMAAWDLITEYDQAVASGLYLFAVEDLDTGKRQVGRFLILK